MGRLPAIFLAGIVLWLAWNVVRYGPEATFGGIYDLVRMPQYGEADRPTRSGDLSDRILGDEDRELRSERD